MPRKKIARMVSPLRRSALVTDIHAGESPAPEAPAAARARALSELDAGAELPASAAALVALEMAVKHGNELRAQAATLVQAADDAVNRALGSGRLTDGLPADLSWGLNHARGVWVKQPPADAKA